MSTANKDGKERRRSHRRSTRLAGMPLRDGIDKHTWGYYPFWTNVAWYSQLMICGVGFFTLCIWRCFDKPEAMNQELPIHISPMGFCLIIVISQSLAMVCTIQWSLYPRRDRRQLFWSLPLMVACIPGDVTIIMVSPFGKIWTVFGLCVSFFGWFTMGSYYFIGQEGADLLKISLWKLRVQFFFDLICYAFDMMTDLGVSVNFIFMGTAEGKVEFVIVGILIFLFSGGEVVLIAYMQLCYIPNIILSFTALMSACGEVPIFIISVAMILVENGEGGSFKEDVGMLFLVLFSGFCSACCICLKFYDFYKKKTELGMEMKEILSMLTKETFLASMATPSDGDQKSAEIVARCSGTIKAEDFLEHLKRMEVDEVIYSDDEDVEEQEA